MKEILQTIYRSIWNEDIREVIVTGPCPAPIILPKTPSEKFYDFAMTFYGIDPTPQDKQNDENACAEVMTTILNKYFTDGFPIITYTPDLLIAFRKDIRFKETSEFKTGNLIISPTQTGNGSVIGHIGTIGKNGKILSNSSPTGLFVDKFDDISWIQRYSKGGQLDLHIFELVI